MLTRPAVTTHARIRTGHRRRIQYECRRNHETGQQARQPLAAHVTDDRVRMGHS
jgi:hypothetical protein